MPQMQRVREEHSAHTCYKIPGIVSELLQAQTADTHIPTALPQLQCSSAFKWGSWGIQDNGELG